MNRKQLIIMWVGIVVIVAMCLFPPWRYRHINLSTLVVTNVAGPYRLVILGPPEVPFLESDNPGWVFDSTSGTYINYDFKGYEYREWRVEIDTPRLIISGIILFIIIGGLMVTFRDRNSPSV